MRTQSLLLLTMLLLQSACDGAYVLGDAHDGTRGSSEGGQNGDTKNDGGAQSAGGSAADGGDLGGADTASADAAGAGGTDPSAAPGLMISPSSLPDARLNRAYVVELAASGGTSPYHFSLVDGALPAGLDLDTAGHLSGTPQAPGRFDFTLQVEDADGARANAEFPLDVLRSHWLATETYPSSASSQVLVNLTDLQKPDAPSIVVEGLSGWSSSFSPDGRWLTYYSYISAEQGGDWYIVDTAGAVPGKPRRLLNFQHPDPCKWAADSSRLVCPKQADRDPKNLAHDLVYFDTSGVEVGPEVALAHADRFAFVDANTLVYADGEGEYSSVSWHGGEPSVPKPLGLSGVKIQRQSADGGRAVVSGNTAQTPDALVDLTTGESTPFPPGLALLVSDSFDAAVSVEPSVDDAKVATYSFYSVSGIHWTLVGQETAELNSRYGVVLPLAGRFMPLVKGSQVLVAEIGESSLEELAVPGEFAELGAAKPDATGRWLYFETADRADNDRFVPASAKHWLSRIESEEPAQLIGEGFLEVTGWLGASSAFSPDGQRFYLHGQDEYSKEPLPFMLLDLTDPAAPKKHVLDVPFNWSRTHWSSDSSFIAFQGSSPTLKANSLQIVDALAPDSPPRILFECNSNPAPLPGCPSTNSFQP
jgi:hypothetical protein